MGSTWARLVEGGCGVCGISPADLRMDEFDKVVVSQTYEQLASKVAAVCLAGKERGSLMRRSGFNPRFVNFANVPL